MISNFENNLENNMPVVEISIDDILHNINEVNSHLKPNQTISLVTKVLAGEKEIVEKVIEESQKRGYKIKSISESHIRNAKTYQDINIEKWLIREPMLNEISDLVKYIDAVFVCELKTLDKINEEAKKINKVQNVLFTYELGDIREGTTKEQLYILIEHALKLENVHIYGIAANLADYGGAIPTKSKYQEYIDLVNQIEVDFNINLEEVRTLPNSSGIKMLLNGETDAGINNCRFGECIWVGTDPSTGEELPTFSQKGFILKAQICEVQEKNLYPVGENLMNKSFDENPMRKKALICIGKQDTILEDIIPLDSNIKVLGGSSDYTVLDITDCDKNYEVGDIVSFKVRYFSLLRLMNSKYVYKKIV